MESQQDGGISLHPALVATLQAAWNSKITIMLVMAIGQWIWRGLCVDLHPTPTVTSNELDLLDMVDEAEQYENRSFVMKHIVPCDGTDSIKPMI
jgi:hypothetical protein